jgi:hypothetical protein
MPELWPITITMPSELVATATQDKRSTEESGIILRDCFSCKRRVVFWLFCSEFDEI